MAGASSIEDFDEAFLALARTAVEDASPEDAIRRLTEELTIRDHALSYADAFDSKALDRIVAHFDGDAILTTPRGIFNGHREIRAFYEQFTGMNRFSYHRIQSVTIRVDANGTGASFAAYFHAPFIGEGSDARSQYGRYLGRLTKHDEGWLFVDWRISIDHTRAYPGSLAGNAATT